MADLPPGFRFQPTHQQLITGYLAPLVAELPPECPGVILEQDLYGPEAEISLIFDKASRSCRHYDEDEDVLYFYTPLKKKYENGSRIDRVAGSGSWTGQDADDPIRDRQGRIIGMKKHYAFTQPDLSTTKRKKMTSPSNGVNWIMHEYRLPPTAASSSPTNQNSDNKNVEHVLCRIRRKFRGKSSSSSRQKLEEDRVQVPDVAETAYNNAPMPPNNAPFAPMSTGYEIVQHHSNIASKRLCDSSRHNAMVNNGMMQPMTSDQFLEPSSTYNRVNEVVVPLQPNVVDDKNINNASTSLITEDDFETIDFQIDDDMLQKLQEFDKLLS